MVQEDLRQVFKCCRIAPLHYSFVPLESGCERCATSDDGYIGRTDIRDPPHRSWSPNAGLLKSPNRPLGKSSQVAALLSSPRPASPSVVEIAERPCAAELAALRAVMRSLESDPGGGCVGVPGVSCGRLNQTNKITSSFEVLLTTISLFGADETG